MPVALDSLYFKTLDKLADLLANCPAFQTWTSTATAAAAKARIYQVYDTASAEWPLAVIRSQNDFAGTRDCSGDGIACFSLSEGATLIMEKTVSSASSDNVKTFCNEVAAIFAEAIDRQSSYLFLSSFSMDGPYKDDELVSSDDSKQIILRMVFSLKWGM